jgi:hypothetical protein
MGVVGVSYTLTFVGGPVDGTVRESPELYARYRFPRRPAFDYFTGEATESPLTASYEYELTFAGGRARIDTWGRYIYRYLGEK